MQSLRRLAIGHVLWGAHPTTAERVNYLEKIAAEQAEKHIKN